MTEGLLSVPIYGCLVYLFTFWGNSPGKKAGLENLILRQRKTQGTIQRKAVMAGGGTSYREGPIKSKGKKGGPGVGGQAGSL